MPGTFLHTAGCRWRRPGNSPTTTSNIFTKQDPNFPQISRASKASEDRLIPLAVDSTYDPAYQNHFFDRHDLIDKASTIGKVEQGSVYCNFYRMGLSGAYSEKDWQLLESILPLITTLISTHYRILQLSPLDEQQAHRNARSLVHNIISKSVAPFSQLTPREREVCERILLGYTSVGIGLDLNIAQSSVVTYRRRAYEKLDISTQKRIVHSLLDSQPVSAQCTPGLMN